MTTTAKAEPLSEEIPYSMDFLLKGTRPFLFSKPPEEMKKATGKAVFKASEMEEKVWRTDGGLGYASEQIVKRLAIAGRGDKNPAPMGKGSAMGPIREGITCDPEVVPFLRGEESIETWDVVAKHWVGPKHGGYAWRPMLEAGWELKIQLSCARPQWFSPADLTRLVGVMGLIGIGDGTVLGYGRFLIVSAAPPDSIEWASGT